MVVVGEVKLERLVSKKEEMVFTPQQSKLSGKNPGAQDNAVNKAHEQSSLKIFSSPLNLCQEVSNMGRLKSSVTFRSKNTTEIIYMSR